MAHNVFQPGVPLKAASVIAQYTPVAFIPQNGSQLSETVIPAGSVNNLPIGMAMASAAAGGEVSVQFTGVSKGLAGASLGAGALVGCGSTNGVLAPFAASGLSTALGSALGSSGAKWVVGVALKNAASGDYFPVLLKPDQIV